MKHIAVIYCTYCPTKTSVAVRITSTAESHRCAYPGHQSYRIDEFVTECAPVQDESAIDPQVGTTWYCRRSSDMAQVVPRYQLICSPSLSRGFQRPTMHWRRFHSPRSSSHHQNGPLAFRKYRFIDCRICAALVIYSAEALSRIGALKQSVLYTLM